MLTAVAALESVREWSSSLRFFSWETSPTDKTNDINGVVPLRSFRASSSDVIVSGHSMGGHGAWILATHLLDARLLGVAVLVRVNLFFVAQTFLQSQPELSTTSFEPFPNP